MHVHNLCFFGIVMPQSGEYLHNQTILHTPVVVNDEVRGSTKQPVYAISDAKTNNQNVEGVSITTGCR